MSEKYAVIRCWDYLKRWDEQPPGSVMVVEKETDASLIGSIVDRGGKERDTLGGYDTRPTTEFSYVGSVRRLVVKRPGRVVRERLISWHLTQDEAFAALERASAAWSEAEDRSAYRETSTAFADAEKRLAKERERLEAELREKLAAETKARDAAKAAHLSARQQMYARMSEAAAAAVAESVPA